MRGLRLTEEELERIKARLGVRWVRGAATQPSRLRRRARSAPLGEPRLPGRAPDKATLELYRQIRLAGLPTPQLNYPFTKAIGRRHEADLCWPSLKLIVEVNGAPHRIKARYLADVERSQLIFTLGYRSFAVLPKECASGRALELVRAALKNTSS